jgi:hypothetical protein
VRYLKEIGKWSDDQQAWNDKTIAEIDALRAAWPDFVENNNGLSEDEFTAAWDEARDDITASL